MACFQATSQEWFYSPHIYLLQMTHWVFKMVSKMKQDITKPYKGDLDCPVSFNVDNKFLETTCPSLCLMLKKAC